MKWNLGFYIAHMGLVRQKNKKAMAERMEAITVLSVKGLRRVPKMDPRMPQKNLAPQTDTINPEAPLASKYIRNPKPAAPLPAEDAGWSPSLCLFRG